MGLALVAAALELGSLAGSPEGEAEGWEVLWGAGVCLESEEAGLGYEGKGLAVSEGDTAGALEPHPLG